MEDFSSMTNTFFQKQALNCIKNGWDILLGRINPWNPVLEYLFLYITMLKV